MTLLTPPSRSDHAEEALRDELEALIEDARRRARRRRARYVSVIALAALVAGGLYALTSGPPIGPRPSPAVLSAPRLRGEHGTGVLTGLIRSAVMPSDPAYSGMPGLVIVFKPSGHVVARETLRGFGHHFRLVLPAGRYQVNVRSEKGDGCPMRNVLLRADRATHLILWVLCTAE